MHFPDLSPYAISPIEGPPKLIAVGWLEPGHDYRRGDVDGEFVKKLVEILVDPWQPAAAGGGHPCGFCRLSGGPASFRLADSIASPTVELGIANVWIPADGFLYVAPSLILHYIDAHGYSPPLEFQAAVLACPPMRHMDYFKAILKNGPKGLVSK